MVLPEPTSPCTSLLIGLLEAMSEKISSIARFWADVSEKGRIPAKSDRGGAVMRRPAEFLDERMRRRPSVRMKSSSKVRRLLAMLRASADEGE